MEEYNQNIEQNNLNQENNNDELDYDTVYQKAQNEFDDNSLEEYNHKLMLQKKFRYISDDPNIQNISSLDENIKNQYEIPQFRKFTRKDEKLTQQEILRKDFKDFLILREFSGRTKNYPHSSRIPNEYVKKTKNIIKIEDSPVISEFDENKNKSSVMFYKNDAGQLELIEVICKCGEKVFIELEYDEGKMVSYSPAIAKSSDIDKNIDNEISVLADNSKDDKTENQQEQIKDSKDSSEENTIENLDEE